MWTVLSAMAQLHRKKGDPKMEYPEQSNRSEYTPGKRYICKLPAEVELIAALTSICSKQKIKTASFSIMGTVLSATIGVFDSKQQVYVTHIEKTATEILSCTGIVSQTCGACGLRGTILLADPQGRITGGRLFADTIILSAELDLQTLLHVPERSAGRLNSKKRLHEHKKNFD